MQYKNPVCLVRDNIIMCRMSSYLQSLSVSVSLAVPASCMRVHVMKPSKCKRR